MHSLTEFQLAILQALWDHGEATVTDVQKALARPAAPSTVATMLARLEKRGLVSHRSEGRQYVYSATVAEADVRRSVVAEFTERTEDLFQGDLAAVVSQLLTAREIKGTDLERLRSLIDQKAEELGEGEEGE